MKKVFTFILVLSLGLALVSCSEDDPLDDTNYNTNNNAGSNISGNNAISMPKVQVASSHSLKSDNGYVSGDVRMTISNRGDQSITSVTVVIKSSNQSTLAVGSWSEIKAGYEKTGPQINLVRSQYPIAVCTYTHGSKKYTKEYSFF